MLDQTRQIPMPPVEFRQLVGPTDPKYFDNPTGELVYPRIPPQYYRKVFDFGCGCGRVARQMALQKIQPEAYLGIDLHPGMIKWCQDHITPYAPQFQFMHHDVFYIGWNKESPNKTLAFPAEDHAYTLVTAISVFTHLEQDSAVFYFAEVNRILEEDGILHATWFLFDKADFPMMQDFQNALYINIPDPVNAVIFDKTWVVNEAKKHNLKIIAIKPPVVRGGQWVLTMARLNHPSPEKTIPAMRATSGKSGNWMQRLGARLKQI